MGEKRSHLRRQHWFAQFVLSAGTLLVWAANAVIALEYDHLLLGKISGTNRVGGKYRVNLDAVNNLLDGSHCKISLGRPSLMLAPVTKTVLPPIPDGHDDSVPSLSLTSADVNQAFVCYKVFCPGRQSVSMTSRDQLSEQGSFTFKRTGRMLCVPSVTQ